MAIFKILNEQLDSRKYGTDCEFNGYLEDYLGLDEPLDPTLKDAFTKIAEQDGNVKICVGLKSEISRNAISNQIIRYKDIFKLSGKVLSYPYLLYTQQGEENRALLVVPYEPNSFVLAKGYYYCMTEPGSLFVDCKNEIVAISSNQSQEIVDTFQKLFEERAGAIQRGIDYGYYRNYDELKDKVYEMAETQKKNAPMVLAELEDRTQQIYQYVIRWFLMKKVLYVQYMVNKNILNSIHEGNIKQQRNQAKANADQVSIMSYSEMWRTNGEEELLEEESQEVEEESESELEEE